MIIFHGMHDNEDEIEVITHHVCLPEIFERFKCFLLGMGYVVDGDIEIVDNEIHTTKTDEEE